jgi:hypothetical protein
MNSNKRQSNLSVIYEWIQKIRRYPKIREQMATMKEYNYQVPKELRKGSIHLSTFYG